MSKSTQRIKFFVTVLLVISFIFLSSSPASSTQQPILIGATVSLEGKYSIMSKMIQLGFRLWESKVNERGGLLGRKVKLIFYDDKSRPELVKKYYQKLILEDKVDLVLSPYGTPLTLVASEITEQHKKVMLAVASAAKKPWERGYKYLFGIYALADRYFISFEDVIARKGYKTLAIIHADSIFHIDIGQAAAIWAKRFGLKVVMEHSFSDAQNQLPDIVKKLQDTAPDGVIFSAYPPASYMFIKILKKLQYRPTSLAMTIVPTYPDFNKNVGPFAEGIFGTSQWEPDERIPFPGTTQFIKEFKEFTGLSPSYHAGSAYSSCKILEQVIKASGTIDHETIRDHISSLDTVTIIGRFKVDQTGRQIGHNPILIQWQNGRKEIVYPRKMKTQAPEFDTGMYRK